MQTLIIGQLYKALGTSKRGLMRTVDGREEVLWEHTECEKTGAGTTRESGLEPPGKLPGSSSITQGQDDAVTVIMRKLTFPLVKLVCDYVGFGLEPSCCSLMSTITLCTLYSVMAVYSSVCH